MNIHNTQSTEGGSQAITGRSLRTIVLAILTGGLVALAAMGTLSPTDASAAPKTVSLTATGVYSNANTSLQNLKCGQATLRVAGKTPLTTTPVATLKASLSGLALQCKATFKSVPEGGNATVTFTGSYDRIDGSRATISGAKTAKVSCGWFCSSVDWKTVAMR